MTNPDAMKHLGELMRELNAAREERAEAMERQLLFYNGGRPSAPLPWHRRVRGKVRGFVRRDRERLARFIAPWLEDEW